MTERPLTEHMRRALMRLADGGWHEVSGEDHPATLTALETRGLIRFGVDTGAKPVVTLTGDGEARVAEITAAREPQPDPPTSARVAATLARGIVHNGPPNSLVACGDMDAGANRSTDQREVTCPACLSVETAMRCPVCNQPVEGWSRGSTVVKDPTAWSRFVTVSHPWVSLDPCHHQAVPWHVDGELIELRHRGDDR